MRRILPTTLALGFLCLSTAAIAREYTSDTLPYSDAPDDRPTAIAISVLTEADVLRGDPSGTFRPNAELNRAEFMTIVMRLLPDSSMREPSNCFPDVAASAWYAPAVCSAKALGIVTGNARVGVPAAQWLFEPNRSVQYEEAVKVLAKIYALPLPPAGSQWYEQYLNAAAKVGLDLSGLVPGDQISRGEMARLAVGFLAYSENELHLLRNAEAGMTPSSSSSSVSSGTGSSVSSGSSTSSSSSKSSSSSSSRSSQSSMSSRSSSSASSMSSWAGGYDPIQSTAIRSDHILLGRDSSILGSINLYSNNEPIRISAVNIELTSAAASIDSLLVYDQDRRYLGRATLSSGSDYRAVIPAGALQLPHRKNLAIYVRARAKSFEQGGTSGQDVRISSFEIEGQGEWTNTDYAQTYSDTFSAFETARAKITAITNAGSTDDIVSAGQGQKIGSFRFTAEGDSQGLSNSRVTAVSFQLDGAGVTVSNVVLRRSGSDTSLACTLGGTTITCTGIPAEIGTLQGGSAVIDVYATIAINSGASNPSFRLTINESGSPSDTGAITWTDGSATFSWVPFDSPVVRGTSFK